MEILNKRYWLTDETKSWDAVASKNFRTNIMILIPLLALVNLSNDHKILTNNFAPNLLWTRT